VPEPAPAGTSPLPAAPAVQADASNADRAELAREIAAELMKLLRDPGASGGR
jgi:hypothetical protein